MLKLIESMKERASLIVREDYDVIYTTGPDLITTVIHAESSNYSEELVIIPQEEADNYFEHLIFGQWRENHLRQR
jgi:hypothetical protein